MSTPPPTIINAFAAVDKSNAILVWSISGTAARVREQVGEAWTKNGNLKDGWRLAKKNGIRVTKIQIRIR